jgi:Ca2+-binding RTX toxin-like protein
MLDTLLIASPLRTRERGPFNQVRVHKTARAGASLNVTARQTVNLIEGGYSLALSIYEMVGKDVKAREGGKAMAARIRRAGVAVALAFLLMATALPGVAYAKNISGTPDNDYLLGTIRTDLIRGRGGDDYIRALAGDDLLRGGSGEDVVRGGGGNDEIYPGEGADIIFAGAGNDKIYARDTDSLDFIDCGGGFDEVETVHRDDRTLDNCERALGPRRGNI